MGKLCSILSYVISAFKILRIFSVPTSDIVLTASFFFLCQLNITFTSVNFLKSLRLVIVVSYGSSAEGLCGILMTFVIRKTYGMKVMMFVLFTYRFKCQENI